MPDELNMEEKKVTKKKSSKKAPSKKKTALKKKPVTKKKTTKKMVPVKESVAIEPLEKRSTPPISFTAKKSEKKRKADAPKMIGLLIVVAIVVILAITLFQTQQIGKESKETASGIRSEVSDEVGKLKEKLQALTQEIENKKNKETEVVYTEYLNQSIGISFKYPEELGDISEELITQDTKKDDDPAPKVLHLTFSGNPDIWLTAASADYKSKDKVVYIGDEESLASLCEEQLSVSDDGYCDLIGLSGQQTVEIVHVLGDDTVESVVKTVPLNIGNSEFSGLTINVSVGTPPVASRNLFAPPTDEDTTNALDDFLRNLIKKESLSLVVKDNLQNYTTILTTLQVLE